MPPEETTAGDQQQQQPDQGTQSGASAIVDKDKYIEALNKRLAERDDELKRFKTQLNEVTAGQRKQLEEQGNFRALAEQHAAEVARLKPIEERAATLEKIIRESNDARIKNVPEQMRDLIPSDYPPEKLQTWLNANESKLVQPPPPRYDAGAGANGSTAPNVNSLTAEEKQVAQMMNMTPEQYLKAKQKTAK